MKTLDSEILLAYVLGKPRSYLYAHPHQRLTAEQQWHFQWLWQRRLHGEPIAYIIGEKMFWDDVFQLNTACLIPRPETELLVELALEKLPKDQPARVLELATGCGAVAISLAKARPHWTVIATDNSRKALAMTQQNARNLQVNNLQLHLGDWFDALQAITQAPFDAILANPPYIADNDPHLREGDVRFEPRCALVSGRDGLNALRQIISQAPHYLKETGWLAVEHGYDQADSVQACMKQHGYVTIKTYYDIGRNPRVCLGGCPPN